MRARRPAGYPSEGGTQRTLVTADGVPIHAVHLPALAGPGPARVAPGLAFVIVHGFTGSWRDERVARICDRLRAFGSVVAIDQRGHGGSGGASTVGDAEVLDVEAAVRWARELDYDRVATVGFSLGGAVVVRQSALVATGPGRADAVVAVSAPAFWYYRGTRAARLVHHLVLTRPGRALLRTRGTRVSGAGWPDPMPVPPVAAAASGSTPLLVVHGDVDRYFPAEHALALYRSARAAGRPADLWLIPGFGHAEGATSASLVDRIGAWVRGHAG